MSFEALQSIGEHVLFPHFVVLLMVFEDFLEEAEVGLLFVVELALIKLYLIHTFSQFLLHLILNFAHVELIKQLIEFLNLTVSFFIHQFLLQIVLFSLMPPIEVLTVFVRGDIFSSEVISSSHFLESGFSKFNSDLEIRPLIILISSPRFVSSPFGWG